LANEPSAGRAGPSEPQAKGRRGVLGWLRRQKDRVEALAESRRATSWLFAIAFAEASFFPIPPDVLLIPLAGSAPRKALRFALVCTTASVLGAIGGWAIGYLQNDTIGRSILEFYGVTEKAQEVLAMYQANAFLAIVTAGFTPIPYKVFTILAGMNGTVSIAMLVAASVVGRGGRFFLVAGTLRLFGPSLKPWIERHFDAVAVAMTVLLIAGFLALKAFL